MLLSHCPIFPQLEGRVPVASSAVVTGHASQESTDVIVCPTAQMGLMRETVVSLLQGGFPFLSLSLSLFFFFFFLKLRLLWHFNQFVKIKRLAD